MTSHVQTAADLKAYVDTLDQAEAMGHARCVIGNYARKAQQKCLLSMTSNDPSLMFVALGDLMFGVELARQLVDQAVRQGAPETHDGCNEFLRFTTKLREAIKAEAQ